MRSLFSHLEVEATHSLGTYGNDISQHCKNALYCMHSRSLRALSNFMAALFYLARGPFRDLPSPMRPGLVSKRGDAKQTVLYILYIYTVYIYIPYSHLKKGCSGSISQCSLQACFCKKLVNQPGERGRLLNKPRRTNESGHSSVYVYVHTP